MVYPGPADMLEAHAKEFLENKQWPKEFLYVTDPDYRMINLYGLRWEAPKETAYPATFVLDLQGIVLSAKISRSHGESVDVHSCLLSAPCIVTRFPPSTLENKRQPLLLAAS